MLHTCTTQLLHFPPVPPRITGSKEEEVSVIEGHMVSLLCDVQAYPPPEITWTRDGQVHLFGNGIHILPGQPSAEKLFSRQENFLCLNKVLVEILHVMSFFHVLGGQMLQLPRVRLEDAGQYVCTATNSAGQDQKNILLSVYGEQTHGDTSAQFSNTDDQISKHCLGKKVCLPQASCDRA